MHVIYQGQFAYWSGLNPIVTADEREESEDKQLMVLMGIS